MANQIKIFILVTAILLVNAERYICYSQSPRKNASSQISNNDSAAMVGGTVITISQLESDLGNKLFKLKSQEYEMKRTIMESIIEKTLLKNEADARKMTVEQLLKIEIEDKIQPVSEDAAQAVQEVTGSRKMNESEVEALTRIQEGIRQQRLARRRAEFIKELREKYPVKVMLTPPRLSIEQGGRCAKGPKTAKVNIIEYADFQCPYCLRAAQTLKMIASRYGDLVRIEYRQFPLRMHKDAAKAAEASLCADDQGKFWEYHDKLFENQKALQLADLRRYALELGLNSEAFGECLDSGKYAETWKHDLEEGRSFGVTGTPTLYINGRLMSGGGSSEVLARIIDEELINAGITPPKGGPVRPADSAGMGGNSSCADVPNY